MNLEEYIKTEVAEGKIDFSFRASVWNGEVRIYIHPTGKDGRTTPSAVVKGNCVELP